MKGMTALGCMVLVACSLALVQAEHKVVAVVLKNPNFQGAPVLKLNAHKVLSAPSDQATIQQTTPIVANAVNPVATPNGLVSDAAPVPVFKEQPKKIIRYKLIRLSDEDIKKEAEAKRQKMLHDAEDAKIKKALYPCRDYSPICGRYKNMWNPAVAQCRDVWMQRNCRETCGLCKIPVGVYLACQDMWHCKKLATHSCVHDWVRETCKTMCGSCDGSKGSKFARVGASSVFVGKKKSLVETKKEKKEDEDKKVETVHQAIKLQAKPIKVEDSIPKESKEDIDDDEKDDLEHDESGDNPDDKDNDDNDDDEMEKQPADVNMENESGDDEDETKDDKPEPETEADSKPAKHASVPKVIKKPEQKTAAPKPVAPKVQHHKQKKTAKKVVHDKKPKAKKVIVVKKVHDQKPKAKKVIVVKKVHDKKAKNPVKALVTKHKKTAHVVHHNKAAKKVKTVKKVAKKN